ncbi:MAG TPA: class I SAM-dependent methyltransferase, partial [Thermoanaerobaculia bacterium]
EFARSAAPGIIAILQKHGIGDGLVVDAGCGSGVLSRALTDAGYEVFGFDLAPAMIEIARDVAPKARFAVASFLRVELPPCRAVLAIGEILMYLSDPSNTLDALRAFFGRVHEALGPGGLLLFDVGRDGAYPPKGSSHTVGDDWEVYVEKWLDGNVLHRRVITYREGRRSDELHKARLYTREEMTGALREAGFSVRVRRSYGTRRLPLTHDVYLARKA